MQGVFGVGEQTDDHGLSITFNFIDIQFKLLPSATCKHSPQRKCIFVCQCKQPSERKSAQLLFKLIYQHMGCCLFPPPSVSMTFLPGGAHSPPDSFNQCECDRWIQAGHHAGRLNNLVLCSFSVTFLLWLTLFVAHQYLRYVKVCSVSGCVLQVRP